jgi:hypothetical protein
MILHGIESELWWLANADEIRSPRGVSVQATFKLLSEAFHFFVMPTAISENYTFEQGRIGEGLDEIIIKQLVLYQSAVHLTISGQSDGADRVFDRLVELFTGLGVRHPTTPPVRFYRSTIICDFDKSIEPLFAKLEAMTSIIQAGLQTPDVELRGSGIAYNADPLTLPRAIAQYNPTLFSINRKADVEFSKNRCTCFANMKTVDHLAALGAIEQLL